MSLRLVVWDLDGTIVDSRTIIQNAMADAFQSCGLVAPVYEDTRKIVGLPLQDGCRLLAPDPEDSQLVDALVDAYRLAFIKNREEPDFKEPLYDGAIELLETLANQNCLQAVATGKSRQGIKAIFGMHDLERYFDTIWCSDDGPGKPNPFMVQEAMKALGCEVGETVMVGDAIHDIHMGRAAGVTTHGVVWGFGTAPELQAAGADHLHEDMQGLSLALGEFAKV